MTPQAARKILGVTASADVAKIRSSYRRLALTAHPDQGGSNEDFIALTAARDLLLQTRDIEPAYCIDGRGRIRFYWRRAGRRRPANRMSAVAVAMAASEYVALNPPASVPRSLLAEFDAYTSEREAWKAWVRIRGFSPSQARRVRSEVEGERQRTAVEEAEKVRAQNGHKKSDGDSPSPL